MHPTRAALLIACLLLGGAACGGDDDASTSGPVAPTTESTSAAAGDEGPADTTTSEQGGEGDGCTNDLALTGSDGADGAVEARTAWADAGPHPDNTVDYDRTLELAIATFEIPVDEQFGRAIPTGEPEVPPGGVILTAYLTRTADQEPIGPGQQFTGVTDRAHTVDDGTINNISAWAGDERLLLGDTTITITSITDDQVCGTLEGVERTGLQDFAVIEGTFALDRIQSLDAAGE